MKNTPVSRKKNYSTPKLKTYGNLRQIVKGGGSGQRESSGGTKP